MKIYLSFLLSVLTLNAWCQQDTAARTPGIGATYKQHTTIATISAGFIDAYRSDFSLPKGFEKNNTSGYALFYGKLEYGVGNKISLAAAFSYDAFVYNYSQLYTGYNGPIKRYKADHFRAFSGGLIAYYHLGDVIHIKRLDPFVGAGVSLNNIHHSELAQGDSTVSTTRHVTSPYLKVGARYYISRQYSLFADLGYDQQSIFSVGFSCRFLPKRQGH